MDNSLDQSLDAVAEKDQDAASPLEARLQSVFLGLHKPKTRRERRPLKGQTNNSRRVRLMFVEELIDLGFSIEQIRDYLPTIGLPLSRSTLYEYLDHVRLPRGYIRTEGRQRPHHALTCRFFVRIAQDAHAAGYRTRKIARGRVPYDKARFSPDFKFEIRNYLYFMEMQLSSLTEARLEIKYRNYVRARQLLGKPFRVLFVMNQRGQLASERRLAAKITEGEEMGKNCFLFINLSELESTQNIATDPVWLTVGGERVPLLQYLR